MSSYSNIEVYTHRKAVEAFLHFIADKTGYVVDETSYSKKALKEHLLQSRALIVREELEMGDDVSENMVQTLPCVEMVEADRNECPCQPASGCHWLRSIEPIPRAIKLISVSDTLAKQTFEFVKWDRMQYKVKSRIKSLREGKYYTIRDTSEGAYIYVYNNRFLENIAVSAIFEDPTHAAAFPKCGEVNLEALCNPLDVDFYTDSYLRDVIFKDAWQTISQVRQAAGLDLFNDDLELTKGQP